MSTSRPVRHRVPATQRIPAGIRNNLGVCFLNSAFQLVAHNPLVHHALFTGPSDAPESIARQAVKWVLAWLTNYTEPLDMAQVVSLFNIVPNVGGNPYQWLLRMLHGCGLAHLAMFSETRLTTCNDCGTTVKTSTDPQIQLAVHSKTSTETEDAAVHLADCTMTTWTGRKERCPKCRCHKPVQRVSTLDSAPSILIWDIQRETLGGRFVHIPPTLSIAGHTLDLTALAYSPARRPTEHCQVASLVGEHWFLFDDSRVTSFDKARIDTPEIQQHVRVALYTNRASIASTPPVTPPDVRRRLRLGVPTLVYTVGYKIDVTRWNDTKPIIARIREELEVHYACLGVLHVKRNHTYETCTIRCPVDQCPFKCFIARVQSQNHFEIKTLTLTHDHTHLSFLST